MGHRSGFFLFAMMCSVGAVACGDSGSQPNPGTPGGDATPPRRDGSTSGDGGGGSQPICSVDALASGTLSGSNLQQIQRGGKYWTLKVDEQYAWQNSLQEAGDPLGTNAVYRTSNDKGPCGGHATDCQVDDVAFGSIGGDELVQVIAYGKYWTMKPPSPPARPDWTFSNPGGEDGAALAANSLYRTSDDKGPCGGHATDCKIDGLAIGKVGGEEIVQVTAYGKYWTMKPPSPPTRPDWTFSNPGGAAGSVLGENDVYSRGPCAGHVTDCKLDGLAIGTQGTKEIVQVMAYGKYWTLDIPVAPQTEWTFSNPSGAAGDTLQANPKYDSGPCAGL